MAAFFYISTDTTGSIVAMFISSLLDGTSPPQEVKVNNTDRNRIDFF